MVKYHIDVALRLAKGGAVWDKPRPDDLGKPHHLSSEQKSKAKAAAKAAGRPYPTLVDNMRAAKASGGGAWTRKEGKNPNGGLNAKGRASLKAQGHDIKPPQPEGGSRRDSFCARMKGMKAKLTSSETANDPDSRINKSLRAWKCADGGSVDRAMRMIRNGYATDGFVKQDINNGALGNAASFAPAPEATTLEQKFPAPNNGTDIAAIAKDPREPGWKRAGAIGAGMASDIAKGALEQAKKPGQTLTGEWDASGGKGVGASDEAVQWAKDTGMGALGTGTAFNRAPVGAVGMFAGPRANFTPMEISKRNVANSMLRQNAPREQVWQWTNSYKDPTGTLQTEFSDLGSKVMESPQFSKTEFVNLNNMSPEQLGIANYLSRKAPQRTTLSQVMDHPELYQKYPHLSDMPVYLMNGLDNNVNAIYSPVHRIAPLPGHENGFIGLNMNSMPKTRGEARSSLLHEINHAINDFEGGPEAYGPEYKHLTEYAAKNNMSPLDAYYNQLDEINSYNVEGRRNLTQKQRETDYPWQNQFRERNRPDPNPENIIYGDRNTRMPMSLEEYKRANMMAKGGDVRSNENSIHTARGNYKHRSKVKDALRLARKISSKD